MTSHQDHAYNNRDSGDVEKVEDRIHQDRDMNLPRLHYILSKKPTSVARSIEVFRRSPIDSDRDHDQVVKKNRPPWHPSYLNNNYCRGVKWAPDGSCLMTNSNDHNIRIFNLPQELLQKSDEENNEFNNRTIVKDELPAVLTIRENSIIYDYVWYTNMDSSEPSTCYLLTSSQNGPVHLWNAYDASLQSTYSIKSQSDEILSINSLAFAGFLSHKILAGYKRAIAIVDVNRPGLHMPKRKPKRKMDRQHGIISCLATNPIDYNLYVAGSYSRQIGIYDIRQDTEPQCLLTGQKGGLTHMKFSSDGQFLFSGGRMDPEILCWDMRNLGEVIGVFKRHSYTNQTMYFDVTPDDKFISTGEVGGRILIWDISRNVTQASSCDLKDDNNIEGNSTNFDSTLSGADLAFQAHTDCVNGISFHPYMPFLASVSGQRHVPFNSCIYNDYGGDSDDGEDKDGVRVLGSNNSRLGKDQRAIDGGVGIKQINSTNIDNSLQVWNF